MEKEITLYTKGYCPYCKRLKSFLNEKSIKYKDIEVSENPDLHAKIIEDTGHRTVPAVFIDGKFIGGSEDFYEWHSKNI